MDNIKEKLEKSYRDGSFLSLLSYIRNRGRALMRLERFCEEYFPTAILYCEIGEEFYFTFSKPASDFSPLTSQEVIDFMNERLVPKGWKASEEEPNVIKMKKING